MANCKIIIPFILSFEGGWSCDPDDAGGATNKGVTIATWRVRGCDNDGDGDIDENDLKRITQEQWDKIFIAGYWNPWKADQIENQAIANMLVDWGWCSGVRSTIKRVQRFLGVAPDGIVGPATLSAINSGSEEELAIKFGQIKRARIEFLNKISLKGNNRKYLKGWLRRCESLNYHCLRDSAGKLVTW